MLRRIFGPKRIEVRGEWKRLHSDELYDLYSSPNIIHMIKRRMKLAGYKISAGECRGAYRILVGKYDGK